MIRTILMLLFWALSMPFAALIGFSWAFLTGDVGPLYRTFNWGAYAGVWLTGVRVDIIGRDQFDHSRSYIFMTNHVSNLDPPIQIPLIPRRTSVMVKKELFKTPILGPAMRMASLLPVDRGNRDAGIEAVNAAKAIVAQGLNMTIYVEGKRSFDGKLLPFKKGPFYLARMRRADHSDDDCGYALLHAQREVRHQAGPRESDLSFADRARGFRLSRMLDGESPRRHRKRVAGRVPPKRDNHGGHGGAQGNGLKRTSGDLCVPCGYSFFARTARAISGSFGRIAEYFSHAL